MKTKIQTMCCFSFIKKKIIILFLVNITFLSCDVANNQTPYPAVFVNKIINLNNIQYTTLRNDGGAVYETGGLKGLIIYRLNANNYLVFDRYCPFDRNASCSKIEIDDSLLYMIDRCCDSQFTFEGVPIAGPAPQNLLRYSAVLTGSLLTINN
ncbi:MAG: hypothetical protein EAZ97_00855 [Bacteroidetes bacterium]|nr:MAG: hypothetical protein EAZ97_00855 [Bacteroidota bacterium]